MANYAEVCSDGTVLRVIVVGDEDEKRLGGEDGVNAWLSQPIDKSGLGLGGTWKKTSYNTSKGRHRSRGQPFRKNFAGIGFKYDAKRNAFVPPKPADEGWEVDVETGDWRQSRRADNPPR